MDTNELREPSSVNAVALRPEQGALATRPPDIGDMLQSVIEKGITGENVAALKELVGLYRDMKKDDARKLFAEAFSQLQTELPKIRATKTIPDKYGKARSSFAPFEEIDAQARPLCLKHGFTYSFAEGEFSQARVTKVCTLQHIGGHERSNQYSVRIGSGPPGCSESQADGAAHSYAKRGALCDALNIVVTGIDNDARMEGGNITQSQADELERRVAETNSNKAAFLKVAGAATFREIKAGVYDVLDQMLRSKEGRK